MVRKMMIAMVSLVLGAFLSSGSFAFTESSALMLAHEHHHEDASTTAHEVCPVSGEELGKESNITYEYKGKTYRFCCPSCAEEFKKDPEKYIEIKKERDEKKS